ncbi:MAG TPA: M50 family metallopeptidase [Gaiellaceae bacterium]|nr:M50 family metallopeptidase [Gaiellaceae bacterium]
MSVVIAILGLAFLILVHEAGHFFTALAVGMRPRRFYVGFPPALVKTTRKGIEYGIGAIPLGGYVKIPGMHRPAESDADVHFGRTLRERPELLAPTQRLKRALSLEDDEGARTALAELEDAGGPNPPEGFERGLQEIEDGLSPHAYWRQRTWKRVVVILAGPATNFVFAVALFAALFYVGGGKATSTVDQVLQGRPAAAAGLRPGDRVLTVNDVVVQPSDIPGNISATDGKPLTLTVLRDGRIVTLGPVRPQKIDGAYRLGFVLRGERLGVGESAWQSVQLTGTVTREIGKSIGRLVHGEGRKDISSPVGISQTLNTAQKQGVETYLWVLGLISLSLALMNLLPLLPLDGGHIAFSIVEGLRGRAVGREIYERVSVIGIALVLFLFFIGLSNDLNRLGGS